MKDNKLEVGDIVYMWRGSFDSYLTKHLIVRLTPKRAILDDGSQVVNDLESGYSCEGLTAKGVGDTRRVHLATEHLASTHRNQIIRNKARRIFNDINIREISIDQCKALIELFPEITKSPTP